MEIKTILGMLLLISLVVGSIGVAAAGDCTEEYCQDWCQDGVCPECQDVCEPIDWDWDWDWDGPPPH
jgi:hypothetical protein